MEKKELIIENESVKSGSTNTDGLDVHKLIQNINESFVDSDNESTISIDSIGEKLSGMSFNEDNMDLSDHAYISEAPIAKSISSEESSDEVSHSDAESLDLNYV